MSTPSTITATIPPSHHLYHYGYSQPQSSYGNTSRRLPDPTSVSRSGGLTNSFSYPNNTPPSIPRHTSSTSMQPRSKAMPPSQSDSRLTHSKTIKRERDPNWDEFYRNGVPKEIIQIDSDSDDQAPPEAAKRPSPRNLMSSNVRGGGDQGIPQPVTKKRKTGGYEPERDQPHYSQPNSSASHTASTDRTTSLQNTAPTSLGSHTSHGSSRTMTAPDPTTATIGQKRKRVVTRRSAADDLRKQKADEAADALAHYCPPPKPPIKAPEVHVAPLRDVNGLMTPLRYAC